MSSDEKARAIYRRQIETAAIGSLILRPDCLTEVRRWLEPDDFDTPLYASWYTHLLDLNDKQLPIDQVTLLAVLRRTGQLGHQGQDAYQLATITEHVPLAAYVVEYCRAVLDESIRRRLAAVGIRLTQLGNESSTEACELVEHARTVVDQRLRADAQRLVHAARPATAASRAAPSGRAGPAGDHAMGV